MKSAITQLILNYEFQITNYVIRNYMQCRGLIRNSVIGCTTNNSGRGIFYDI